ncbi:MAG: hypothetical protein AAFV62_02750 [Pseudomonadota bacterium]
MTKPTVAPAHAETRFLTVGTCRLQMPLRMVQRRYGFGLLNKHATYGFVHSAAEARLQLEWAHGNITIPDPLWTLVSAAPPRGVKPWIEPDYAALEICTLKEPRFEGMPFQMYRLKTLLNDEREIFRIFTRLPKASDRAERLQLLQRHPNFSTLPELLREVLSEATVERASHESLVRDIGACLERLPERSVVVTHCDAYDVKGSLLADRRQAIEAVLDAATVLGARTYNPSLDMERTGMAKTFKEDGRDVGHFTTGFSDLVGAALCRTLGLEATKGPETVDDEDAIAYELETADFDTLKERAVEARTAERWEEMQLIGEAMARLKPTNAMTLQTLARAAIGLGDPEAAVEVWDAFFNRHPLETKKLVEALNAAIATDDGKAMLGYARRMMAHAAGEGGADADVRYEKIVRHAAKVAHWHAVSVLARVALEYKDTRNMHRARAERQAQASRSKVFVRQLVERQEGDAPSKRKQRPAKAAQKQAPRTAQEAAGNSIIRTLAVAKRKAQAAPSGQPAPDALPQRSASASAATVTSLRGENDDAVMAAGPVSQPATPAWKKFKSQPAFLLAKERRRRAALKRS